VIINYCPQCGHSTYPDTTAEKKFGVQVVLCPVDHIRLIYIDATQTFSAVTFFCELPVLDAMRLSINNTSRPWAPPMLHAMLPSNRR
jgi:hypothetical protein